MIKILYRLAGLLSVVVVEILLNSIFFFFALKSCVVDIGEFDNMAEFKYQLAALREPIYISIIKRIET